MNEFEKTEHWDKTASQYQKTAHPFTSRFAEYALSRVPITSESRVLDIATGTGALSLAAARMGAHVVATDFSAGMVDVVAVTAGTEGLSNLKTRVMDGQALDLPDASFDAVFSIFGVMMFPDWRKGLSEMARVTRVGGYGVVGTWQARGAATFLLLGQIRAKLFPDLPNMPMPGGIGVLADPLRFADELVKAGYKAPQVTSVTFDCELDLKGLTDPDKLFSPSPGWTSLSDHDKDKVIAEIATMAGGRAILPIPSTALIGVGVR